MFTYRCCSLNWDQTEASIGFSAGSDFFVNHPLSQTSNVNNIACLNASFSDWTNIVYKISEGVPRHKYS